MNFVREYPLEWGGRTYLFDFAFPEQRVVLETNGRRWHDDPSDYEHDQEKWSVPGRLGHRIVFATWEGHAPARAVPPRADVDGRGSVMLSVMSGASGSLRVAVLDDYQGVALDYADWNVLPHAEVVVFHDHVETDDELVERLAGFEVVVAMRERTPFTRARLARLPDLRLLVTTGMGNAAIDVGAARELGVVVCGTGGLRMPTAELTWGLILAVARQIPNEDRDVRAGGWQRTVGTDLAGATLGVVGLGNLGAAVARIGQAFGMTVLAWSQNLTPERAAECGVERVEKEELFRRADFVTIHLVLSERTRGLVGRAELESMKPTAYLVNTSRGPIVDEEALAAVLEAGTIAGAGLDVFGHEPLPPDHVFRRLPNVVVTPHLGYVTHGTYRRFYTDIVEDIEAYTAGAPIRVING